MTRTRREFMSSLLFGTGGAGLAALWPEFLQAAPTVLSPVTGTQRLAVEVNNWLVANDLPVAGMDVTFLEPTPIDPRSLLAGPLKTREIPARSGQCTFACGFGMSSSFNAWLAQSFAQPPGAAVNGALSLFEPASGSIQSRYALGGGAITRLDFPAMDVNAAIAFGFPSLTIKAAALREQPGTGLQLALSNPSDPIPFMRAWPTNNFALTSTTNLQGMGSITRVEPFSIVPGTPGTFVIHLPAVSAGDFTYAFKRGGSFAAGPTNITLMLRQPLRTVLADVTFVNCEVSQIALPTQTEAVDTIRYQSATYRAF